MRLILWILIALCTALSIVAEFIPRETAPAQNNSFYYTNNIFYQCGYGMPNCTAYAWGRFYELTGEYPRLSTGDAENWYGKTSDGYARGKKPKLGAVICWARGVVGDDSDGAGHVAIVEKINSDGSIETSNSAWNSTNFYMQTLTKASGYTWSDAYTFQGFIYNPIDFEGGSTPEPSTEFYAGNFYLTESQMQTNARYIYNYLAPRGWTLNAIAGMLGNMQTESSINPAIWESLNEGNTSVGYGLVQWTPATNFLNWCTERGIDPAHMDSALRRIEYELANGLQYYPTDTYPLTFEQFKYSAESPSYLAMAFLLNYERPADQDQPHRGTQAEYWYNYLSNEDPTPPVDPDEPVYPRPIQGHKLNLILAAAALRK